MKIQIVGSNKKIEDKINDIIVNLPNVTMEVVNKLEKLNINKYPAIIIENVLVDDINILSKSELKNVILQFFET